MTADIIPFIAEDIAMKLGRLQDKRAIAQSLRDALMIRSAKIVRIDAVAPIKNGLLDEWMEICELSAPDEASWTAKQSGDETEWRIYADDILIGTIESELDATLITIAPRIKDLILHIQQLDARIACVRFMAADLNNPIEKLNSQDAYSDGVADGFDQAAKILEGKEEA